MPPTARPRRRKRLLDLDAIIEAALALVDEQGRLTMSELAARLGTSASSIYHHVNGRTEIIELIRDRISQHLDADFPDQGTWEQKLTHWVRALHGSLISHPQLVPLLNAQSVTSLSVLRGYDRVAETLRDAGFPAAERMLWISVLDELAIGSALDRLAPDEVWQTSDGQTPALDEALASAPCGVARVDAAFELGLEAVIVGMRARLASTSPRAT
ncbi:TetR/AcrR family transcriptional regulator [Rhodococcus sp. NPDC057529]|uniref:TetR/AcrR family transcriptional regulator n=1 Tax=Rhodococcus sp. NPDC057529 TaxID=3346158 RepID=UPI003671E4B4